MRFCVGGRPKALPVLAAILSLVLCGAAKAALVTSFDPDTVVSALQAAGYKAKLARDDDGSPIVETVGGGRDIKLAFSGCTDGHGCSWNEFVAAWRCDSVAKACARAGAKRNGEENFARILSSMRIGSRCITI
jgi:hypothetical protein